MRPPLRWGYLFAAAFRARISRALPQGRLPPSLRLPSIGGARLFRGHHGWWPLSFQAEEGEEEIRRHDDHPKYCDRQDDTAGLSHDLKRRLRWWSHYFFGIAA